MQYLLLIHTDMKAAAEAGPAERAREWEEYMKYTAELRESGSFLGANALHGPETATTVRVSDGETLLTDGPFAETKEQLGGYYLVECDDLDAALDWAARCPGARTGALEVRPVLDLEVPTSS